MCASGAEQKKDATATTVTTAQLPVVKLKGPRYLESFLPYIKSARRGKLHKFGLDMMAKHGENFVVRFPFPWSRVVFLTEPQAIKHLLEVVNPEKPAVFKRGFDVIAKDSLITAEWDTWLRERQRVAPTMTERYVGDLHRIFEEEAAHLWARLDNAAESGDAIEMNGALMGTLFDMIARITIGRSLGMRADTSSTSMSEDIKNLFEASMLKMVYLLVEPFCGRSRLQVEGRRLDISKPKEILINYLTTVYSSAFKTLEGGLRRHLICWAFCSKRIPKECCRCNK